MADERALEPQDPKRAAHDDEPEVEGHRLSAMAEEPERAARKLGPDAGRHMEPGRRSRRT
jgi:hypothetical protein